MRVFILPDTFTGTAQFTLNSKDSHYITRVLRYQVGDLFTGRDRQGDIWNLVISEIHDRAVTLSCSRGEAAAALSDSDTPELHLFQALCKGRKMDQIIRQATEIGTAAIVPVHSRFTVSAPADSLSKARNRYERWETIVKEAMQQSGSPIFTQLHDVLTISEAVTYSREQKLYGIFFHQDPLQDQSLPQLIEGCQQATTQHRGIALFIGPEGGFSAEEVKEMLQAGMHQAYLKTNILRAETAAVYALAVVQALLRG